MTVTRQVAQPSPGRAEAFPTNSATTTGPVTVLSQARRHSEDAPLSRMPMHNQVCHDACSACQCMTRFAMMHTKHAKTMAHRGGQEHRL